MKEAENISFQELKQLANGELSAKRAAELHLLMEENEELNDIYQGILHFQQKEKVSIEDFAKEAKAKLNNQIEAKQPKKVHLFTYVSALAAVLIVGFFSFNWWQSQPERYDYKDAGIAVHLSDHAQLIAEAMNNYKSGNLDAAAEQLDQLLLDNPKNDTLLYYRAVIHKINGNYTQALELMQEVKHDFKAKKEFQFAILHWYLGEEDEAAKGFRKIIATPGHPFVEKSIKALAVLE